MQHSASCRRPLGARYLPALAAVLTLALLMAIPAGAEAAFGIEHFDASVTLENGESAKLAGTHPDALHTSLQLNKSGPFADGDLRNLEIALPPGFLINPTVVAESSAVDFNTRRTSPYQVSNSGEDCPNATQVGVAAVHSSFAGGSTLYFGIFNLVPRFGSPGAVGLAPFGVPIVFNSSVREADAGLILDLEDLSQAFNVDRLELTIWGTPWSQFHDGQRGDCLNEQTGGSLGEMPLPGQHLSAELNRSKPTSPCRPTHAVSNSTTASRRPPGRAARPRPRSKATTQKDIRSSSKNATNRCPSPRST